MKIPVSLRRSLLAWVSDLFGTVSLDYMGRRGRSRVSQRVGFVREPKMRVGRLRLEPANLPFNLAGLFHSDPWKFRPCAAADRYVVDRLGTSVLARDHVFGVGREPVLVKVESLDLALGRDTQSEAKVDGVHQRHRHDKSRDRDREASDH